MIEDQPKKSRIVLAALPFIGKVIRPILVVVVCICLAVLAQTGADTLNPAMEQVDALIESGELPECVKDMVIGMAMILMTGMLGIWALMVMTRK